MSFSQLTKKCPGSVIALILDCDGVILESVSAKTDAFRELFSFAPEYVDEIVAYHLDNGGMSRFEKFKHIYSHILKKPLSNKRFEELSNEFSSIVYQKVMDSPFVDGSMEFLERYHNIIPLYVVSATPEKELIEVLKGRGIIHFFKEVYGSPEKKKVHLKNIIQKLHGSPESVLFVGDAKNDYDAGRGVGIRFIARIQPGEPDRFCNLPGIEFRIKDLHDLNHYLRDLLC